MTRDDDPDLVAFCRRLHPTLVRGLALHLRDRGLAEDVAQETLVRVWERWATVRLATSRDAWAWRVALNLATSRHRRRAAEGRAYARVGPAPDHDRATAADDAVDRLAVRDAVAALPDRQRAALVLRYFADLSVDDTAAVLDCAPGTVKSLTSKAVDGLRRRLGDAVEVLDHA